MKSFRISQLYPGKHHRDQNSIVIILEYQSVNNVKNLRLCCTNSGCNTHECHPITVTADNLLQLFLVDCITCLDMEYKQCTPELDIMYLSASNPFKLSCIIYSKALLFISRRVNVS